MTHSPEDLTVGARVMYEAHPEVDSRSRPLRHRTWGELPESQRDKYRAAFAFGLTAMPDHTAELLEPLEKCRVFFGSFDYPDMQAYCADAMAKFRTQRGDGNG